MTYAYLRVSTVDQNNEKFENEVLKYSNIHNLGHVEFIGEKVSGTKNWRLRKLGELIGTCKKGDVIIVPELSRLARSISQIYEIIDECRKKGIILHIIKQNLVITDESDMSTKIMINTFSLIAELEREFISIRTKEALQSKKAAGVKLGRPKGVVGKSKLDEFGDEIIAFKNTGSSNIWISNKYDVSSVSVGNWLKKHSVRNNGVYTRI